MLSRLAESFFWLGRYLERAEGTTRLLNEFHSLIVQDNKSHAAHGCGIFSQRFGVEISKPNAPELIRAVYGAPNTPNTVLGSLNSARSNARAVRDALPSDFYESINKLYASTSTIDLDSPGQDLRMIL